MKARQQMVRVNEWKQRRATEKGGREGEQRTKNDFPGAEKGFSFCYRPCLSICEVRQWRKSGHGPDYHYR